MCVPIFRSVALRIFLAKIPFCDFFHYHGNYFLDFLAHVLSWVKTYHHAKFQRNPPRFDQNGGTNMDIQAYRQTEKSPKHTIFYSSLHKPHTLSPHPPAIPLSPPNTPIQSAHLMFFFSFFFLLTVPTDCLGRSSPTES